MEVAKVHLALFLNMGLTALKMENANWLIPMNENYQKILAVQLGTDCLQLWAMLFSLNTLPKIFYKMMKPMAKTLSRLGVKVPVDLDDWLVQGEFPLSAQVTGTRCLNSLNSWDFL